MAVTAEIVNSHISETKFSFPEDKPGTTVCTLVLNDGSNIEAQYMMHPRTHCPVHGLGRKMANKLAVDKLIAWIQRNQTGVDSHN
jgi:hypothetical protein